MHDEIPLGLCGFSCYADAFGKFLKVSKVRKVGPGLDQEGQVLVLRIHCCASSGLKEIS